MIQIPKIDLTLKHSNVLELKNRYGSLYIPSDFSEANIKWVDVFPTTAPLNLKKPCSFHVMHKDINPIKENDAIYDPPDADYLYSAKVIARKSLENSNYLINSLSGHVDGNASNSRPLPKVFCDSRRKGLGSLRQRSSLSSSDPSDQLFGRIPWQKRDNGNRWPMVCITGRCRPQERSKSINSHCNSNV